MSQSNPTSRPLGEMKKGTQAFIRRVGGPSTPHERVNRLLEMGFVEGSWVEVLHEAPFGGDPIVVRVRGALVALRRAEASMIWVEWSEESSSG
ncbi:MAG: FeoA family protein [Bdellovibrionia bacterium]